MNLAFRDGSGGFVALNFVWNLCCGDVMRMLFACNSLSSVSLVTLYAIKLMTPHKCETNKSDDKRNICQSTVVALIFRPLGLDRFLLGELMLSFLISVSVVFFSSLLFLRSL